LFTNETCDNVIVANKLISIYLSIYLSLSLFLCMHGLPIIKFCPALPAGPAPSLPSFSHLLADCQAQYFIRRHMLTKCNATQVLLAETSSIEMCTRPDAQCSVPGWTR